MKKLDSQNKIIPESGEKLEKKTLTDLELFENLIRAPQAKAEREFSDSSLDKRFLEIELIGGTIIYPNQLILSLPKPHSVTFSQAYYKNIYRLNNWKVSDAKIYRKSWKVATWTIELIYGRFTKETLPELQHRNPYVSPGHRRFKHFQYLSEKGQQMVELFIEQMIEVMETCNSWYEFREKMFEEYGITYQLKML